MPWCLGPSGKLVRLILQHGDIRAVTKNSRTLLHAAAASGGIYRILQVPEAFPYADLDAVDNEGVTPLYIAAEECYGHEVVQFLLGRGENAHPVNKKTWTMLHASAVSGTLQTIICFQKYNLDVNAVDSRGVTPLHCVAEAWVHVMGESVVKWLIDHGADISATDGQGRIVLHYVVLSKSQPTVISFLKNYRMAVDAMDNNG
jgi:ankyrin repeat protein